jgi:hypothetical protein
VESIDLHQCRIAALPAIYHRVHRRPVHQRERMPQPPELQMDIEVSDLIVGILMTVFGLVGLILAAGATDDEMYVFGLSLAGFAVVFVIGLIRRHYDKQDARRHRGTDYV